VCSMCFFYKTVSVLKLIYVFAVVYTVECLV